MNQMSQQAEVNESQSPETPEPPPNGDAIKLVFEIPGGDVRARAIVRDCQPRKGMGIEFTSMGPEARARLHRLIKTLIKV